MLTGQRRTRSLGRGARAALAGAVPARPGRRALDRASRGRARRRARLEGDRRADGPLERRVDVARGRRRGARRRPSAGSSSTGGATASSPAASSTAPARPGYGAIVVTLDTLTLGWRDRDLRNGYLPFLGGEGLAQFFSDPLFRERLDAPPEEDLQTASLMALAAFPNLALTWSDLAWLRERTELPVVAQGDPHGRGCPARTRPRRRRDRRLQPRRPAGRRRGRLARRARRGARRGRRRTRRC